MYNYINIVFTKNTHQKYICVNIPINLIILLLYVNFMEVRKFQKCKRILFIVNVSGEHNSYYIEYLRMPVEHNTITNDTKVCELIQR